MIHDACFEILAMKGFPSVETTSVMLPSDGSRIASYYKLSIRSAPGSSEHQSRQKVA